MLSRKEELLSLLGTMRENLQETVREATEIRNATIQEEILMELERMNRFCNRAIRDTMKTERLLKESAT